MNIDNLKGVVPDSIIEQINQHGGLFGINTPLRLAHFLAQCAHESGGFKFKYENLNYSESGLLKVFSKYFTLTTAKTYARQPEKIGSRVYANRMGNGPESSQEGFKYRGRGYIQLTGKDNYRRFGKMAGHDWVSSPDTVATLYKADSACLYWVSNKLSKYAIDSSIVTVKIITYRINAGDNGLPDRVRKFNKYWTELQKNPTLWS